MSKRMLISFMAVLLALGLAACEDTTKLREGSALKGAQKYEEAIARFEGYLTENPDTPRAEKIRREIADCYYRMGELNAQIKKWPEAIAAMEKVIKDHRESPRRPDATFRVPTYYIQYAEKLFKDDQYVKAAEILTTVAERYPGTVASKDAAKELRRIGVVSFVSGGDVWLSNADGSGARRLVEGAIDPDLSPDGLQVAFIKVAQATDDRGVLMVTSISGEEEPVELRKSPTAYRPRWSPDGEEIVVTKRTTAKKLFQILNVEKRDSLGRDFFGVQGLDTIGDYKPNGMSFIGFSQRREKGLFKLTEVNLKFAGFELMTFEDAPVRTATYTPDGRMVVYAREDGLYLLNPKGETEVEDARLLIGSKEHGNLDIQFLDVSPDGRHIVLLAKGDDDPDYRLYTASLRKELKKVQILVDGEEIFPQIGTVSWEKGWLL